MNQELLPNVRAFLQSIFPFSLLPDQVLDAITCNIDILLLNPGQELAPDCRATFLYLIRSGAVQQNHLNGQLRSRLASEDIFGFNLQQVNSQNNYIIKAIENTLLYRIDYLKLMAQVKEYPQVASQLALNVNTRLHSTHTFDSITDSQHHYMRLCGDTNQVQIVNVSAEQSIQSVAHAMSELAGGLSCAFITDSSKHLLGMVTDKEMTNRVVAQAIPITSPVSEIMTTNVHTVQDNDLLLTALHLMMQYQVQYIPVLNSQKQVVGLITPQDLIQKNGGRSIYLLDRIYKADSIETLISLAKERNQAFEGIMESRASPNLIGQILTKIYDAFTYRLLELAIKQFGNPPCQFSWIVAGSHARNEIHLSSDQDNAIIISDDATESDRTYFQHLAMYVCKGLSQLGYPLCTGRFMAATPQWCHRESVWKAYFRKWATNPEYELLLNLNVFVEIRHIYGNETIFQTVDSFRYQLVKNNKLLISALIRNSLRTRPPLGIFRNLVLDKDGQNNNVLNIKKSAIGCLVDIVRIYNLIYPSPLLNTSERIEHLYKNNVFNKSSYLDIKETYQYVNQLRYESQLKSIQKNLTTNNLLQPDSFGSFERQHLKDAFRIISSHQDLIKMKFIG